MALRLWSKLTLLLVMSFNIPVTPVQLQQGEEIVENHVPEVGLQECLNVEGRNRDLGVCFGSEVLKSLKRYDEQDSFSLATGVSFIRDEKIPRDFGSFLDKDPMDFRAMMEGASDLISQRSLQWDLSQLYPGLVMRVGPTLANGLLEFVMDPRVKETHRTYQAPDELSTGRLVARNLLVPFLLGFKFKLSTLLPLLLGLLLVASKKAFLLAKLAIVAVTVFGGAGALGGGLGAGAYPPTLSAFSSPYTSAPGHHHGYYHGHGSGEGGYHRPHHDYYYKEKSSEPSTATPITPGELRDRLEQLFITKNEMNQPREAKNRDNRNFAWSPVV